MSIIKYLPEWLQPIWSSIYDTLIILVPFLDIAGALFLVYNLYNFLSSYYTIRSCPEDLGHKDTYANDVLTCVAVDLHIVTELLECHEDIKEEFGKVRKDSLIALSIKRLRRWDMKQFLAIGAILTVIGFPFGAYFSLAVLAIQGVLYSVSYERLVPVVFEFRKKLNYQVIEER